MSTPPLTVTSYLVLGLVAQTGPTTPYEMKQKVAMSIGHFWAFPHSQLYAEPERLVAAGLLDVQREDGGRRRKQYSMTPAGRSALLAWLRDPETEDWEIRDPGLLKLFFLGLGTPDDVVDHAKRQADAHRRRIATYQAIHAVAAGLAPPLTLATLDLGARVSQTYVAFWDELAAHPPDAAT